MTKIRSIRAVVVPLVTASAVVGLTACGSSDDDAGSSEASETDGGGTSNTASETESGTLDEPVTIEHIYGSTEIDQVPERIVTIDQQWTDTMLAMGIEPVGYTVDQYMPESRVPWQDLPADAEGLSLTDGLPVEQIASLQPDLIVGAHSITDERIYEQLSGIAPTIPLLDDREVTPWQDIAHVAGEVLADPGGAEEVISSVDDQVSATAEELPGLEGKTFALAQYVVGDTMYIVADEEDGSTVFFEQLGMDMFPPVRSEGETTGEPRVNVSTERADLLEADLVTFLVNGGDESDLADISGFDQLPGTVAVLDYPTVAGLNAPTPLSIPHALEQLRPYLADAAGASNA
ncbi:ABC transporter substrate-binding protein [Phytoactinopolyspora endophytica]|uniref:ABC transporter substrate-binding protein n=1 Tax=Phytoactinopolyspora endophytica TaxID=1642495 RepID=UPI00101BC109|nr:ABC transporter substrate-binding protein [Phytoactinopolyspora endophytica]